MPTTIEITAPDGRLIEITPPEGVTREQALAQVPQILARLAPVAAPVAPAGPSDVPQIGAQIQGRGLGEGPARLTIPFINARIPVSGRAADVARFLTNLEPPPEETTLPLIGAMAGASFAPPIAAARAVPGLLNIGRQAITRFGPSIGLAGAGGAAGGALSAAGGTPGEILDTAGRAGVEMAAGEAAGLGIGRLAARIAAPALGRMTDVGRQALGFAREHTTPGLTRAFTGREFNLPISPADVAPGGVQGAVQRVVDTLLPSRLVVQSRRRAVVNRVLEVPISEQSEIIRRLIRLDTSDVDLPQKTRIAQSVGRALGAQARRFGFDAADTGPRRLVSNVFERATPQQLDRIRRRMGANQFNDALTLNLGGIIERAVVVERGGRRVLDGERLLSVWRNLPEHTRRLYPRETQEAIEGLGAYAAVHRMTPELAAQPNLAFGPTAVTTGVGMAPQVIASGMGAAADFGTPGIGAGVSFLMARSLMDPKGFLNRWLTNETLPPEFLREVGSQGTRLTTRLGAASLLDEEEDE